MHPAEAALERDRTKVADIVTALKKELAAYDWLISSRGSYQWDDDRWHDEFRRAHDAILKAIEPLVAIGMDLSNCPKNEADIMAARAGSTLIKRK